MKTHLIKIIGLFIFFQFLGVQSVNSQDQKLKTKYKTWLVTTPDIVTSKAHLYQLKDSSINFANSLYPLNPGFSKEIEIRNIDVIKVRRKGRVFRGTLIGAVSGLVLGIVIGNAAVKTDECDDPCPSLGISEEAGKILVVGLVGTVVGGSIGAAIGSMKVSIPINGKQSKYQEQKIKLQKYLIR
jgi:hypothetical protein